MKSSLIKTPVIVLMAFLLFLQGALAGAAGLKSPPTGGACKDCCSAEGACAMPMCCAAESKSSDSAPATAPKASRDIDSVAVVNWVAAVLRSPDLTSDTAQNLPDSIFVLTTTPIFQLGCSYLL